MNKRLLAVALSFACGAFAVSATAFGAPGNTTQNDHPANAAPTAQPATQKAATPKTAKKAERAVPKPGSRMCLRSTGSHIPPPKGQCLPVAGDSYSQKDIQRTGQLNVGQALQMLDPSVTVHGH